MSDQRNSGVTLAVTKIIDRDGRRVLLYHRKTPGPSKQERARMEEAGLQWCRGCKAWLGSEHGVRKGVCRKHANAEYRANYAAGGKVAIAQRVHARKRKIAPIQKIGVECLMEKFDGKCAYCDEPETTFDHVIAVA